MEKINYGAGVFVIKHFLTQEECQGYIEKSEGHHYEEATIQSVDGPELIKNIRDNDRIIFDDQKLSTVLFNRAKNVLPQTYREEWSLLGFNERFRFYRYMSGQYFKWHKDGFFCRAEAEVSQLSFLIYLNDDFDGGNTEFRWDVVKPEQGMALVFPHLLEHQGAEVISGVKYVLRTDVMYRRNV